MKSRIHLIAIAVIAISASFAFAQNEEPGIKAGPTPGEFIVSAEKLKSLMMSLENKTDSIAMLNTKLRIQDSLFHHYEGAIAAGANHIGRLSAVVDKQDSLYEGYKKLYADLAAIAWPTPANWTLIPGAGLLWNKDRLEPVGQLSAFHRNYGVGMVIAPSLYGGMAQYKFDW